MRLLKISHECRVPPETLIRNFAMEHRGSYRRRLNRLARRLGEGSSIVESLEQTTELLGNDKVLALRFATQNGTLPQTLERMVAEYDGGENRAQSRLRQSMFYIIVLGFVMTCVLLRMAWRIIPMLSGIMGEFQYEFDQIEPPLAFRSLIASSSYLTNLSPAWLFLAVGVLLFWCFTPLRRITYRQLAKLRLRKVLPNQTAGILNLLADTAAQGRPIASGISTLARYHYDKHTRQRLLVARNEIELGSGVWDSLADVSLLKPNEAQGISELSTSDSRAWAMRTLASIKREAESRRLEKIVSLVQPAVVLVFAAVVLWIGMAMFEFLTTLDHYLAKP